MDVVWTRKGVTRQAPVPDAVLPIAEIIGIELTAKLLIDLGGSEVYLARRPSKGLVERSIGEEAALKLGEEFGGSHFAVPLGSSFVARVLCAQGYKTAAIIRIVRRGGTAVRGYLNQNTKCPPRNGPGTKGMTAR